jgi:phage gp36-like protein
MTYSAVTDIENELKNTTFSSTSIVTSTAVSDFISQADATIDMYLSKRYSLPITDATALIVLKNISIDIVTFRVAKILDLKKSGSIPDNHVVQDITNGDAYKESMRKLVAIRDGVMDLIGETAITPQSSLSSLQYENSDLVPFFQKGVDQW